MYDLNTVRKVIISLVNPEPNGILAEKLYADYSAMEGHQLPFASFGYSSLISFLENELKENVRIVNDRLNIKLFPIATEKSGHIMRFNQEVQENKKRLARSQAQRNGHHQNAGPSRGSHASRETQNRSPTMPALVPYRPFQLPNNRSLSDQKKVMQEILLQSQKEFLERKRRDEKIGQQQNPNRFKSNGGNKSNGSNAQGPTRMVLQQINTRINALEVQPSTSRAKIEHQRDSSTPVRNTPIANVAPPKPEEFESLWEDELDSLGPPSIHNSNSNSFYGVSSLSSNSDKLESKGAVSKKPIRVEVSSSDEGGQLKNLLGELHVGDTVPVKLSDVNNPLKFWVHIRQEKYEKQINELHHEMQTFYAAKKKSDELKITDPAEMDDEYFAAFYNSLWHRVELHGIRMGESVGVSFCDHGTRDIINISNMRILPKRFWKTPRAAVCCALGGIKPIGTAFSNVATDVFYGLVDSEDMFAKILKIDSVKSKVMVEIVLKSNKLCVNNELVRLNHATAKKPTAAHLNQIIENFYN